MKKRIDATQLPNADEISDIFARESKRAQPKENINRHFVSLDVLDLLADLKVDLSFREAVSFDDISTKGKLFVESFITALKDDHIDKEVIDMIFSYLAECDEPTAADGIFVFGRDRDISRAVTGVELYKQGLAPKLVLAGGHPAYKTVDKSEAEKMREYAISEGVQDEDLLLETESITVPGNIFGSLDMFDEVEFDWNSMILVMSPFAMRRATGFFQKFTTGKSFIRVCAYNDTDMATADLWHKQEDSVRYVMNEFVKLRIGLASNTI